MFVFEVPELKGLAEELDALLELDVAALTDTEVTALLVGLRRERDRLDGLVARVGDEYVVRRAWAADGARSPAAHLAGLRGEPEGAARADLRFARALAGLPLTSEALARGEITRGHAERLAHAAGAIRRDVFLEHEPMLVAWARTRDGWTFQRALRHWVMAADDHAADLDARARERDRWATGHRDLDQGWHFEIQSPRVAGAEIAAAHERLCDELFRADWAAAKVALGRDPSVAELARTPAQRSHDAWLEMARRAMSAPPGSRLPVPLTTVILNREALERVCELADGTPISHDEALQAITGGDIRRAVFTTPLHVEISQTARLFRGATREAVKIRDRFCTFVSPDGVPCHEPAERCDVDHIMRVEDGGLTVQENGQTRCENHHEGRRREQPWLAPEQAARRARQHADGNADDAQPGAAGQPGKPGESGESGEPGERAEPVDRGEPGVRADPIDRADPIEPDDPAPGVGSGGRGGDAGPGRGRPGHGVAPHPQPPAGDPGDRPP